MQYSLCGLPYVVSSKISLLSVFYISFVWSNKHWFWTIHRISVHGHDDENKRRARFKLMSNSSPLWLYDTAMKPFLKTNWNRMIKGIYRDLSSVVW